MPVFIDLAELQVVDIFIVVLLTILSVGGVKIFYALSAIKITHYLKEQKFKNITQNIAGMLMLGTGAYLILKA